MARPPTFSFLDTLVSVAHGWPLLLLASEKALEGLSLLGRSVVAVCLCDRSVVKSSRNVRAAKSPVILAMLLDLPLSCPMVTGSFSP